MYLVEFDYESGPSILMLAKCMAGYRFALSHLTFPYNTKTKKKMFYRRYCGRRYQTHFSNYR